MQAFATRRIGFGQTVFPQTHRFRDDAELSPGCRVPLLSPGSVYLNDHLLAADGCHFDPILETETGGSPVGAVTLDHLTGPFKIDVPPDPLRRAIS